MHLVKISARSQAQPMEASIISLSINEVIIQSTLKFSIIPGFHLPLHFPHTAFVYSVLD